MPEEGRCFSIGIGNITWASGNGPGEVCGSREKFSGVEGGAERGMRLHRARGSALLCNAFGWDTEKWHLR